MRVIAEGKEAVLAYMEDQLVGLPGHPGRYSLAVDDRGQLVICVAGSMFIGQGKSVQAGMRLIVRDGIVKHLELAQDAERVTASDRLGRKRSGLKGRKIRSDSAIPNSPPAVRILPLDSTAVLGFVGRTHEEIQTEFFHGRFIQPGNSPGMFHFRKRGLVGPKGTVVLFQYRGKIVASGVMLDCEEFAIPDGPYKGAMHFDPESIKVFDPVGLETVREVWPNVVAFGQARWNLDPKKYAEFVRKMTNITDAT